MDIQKDFRDLLALFNESEVDYVIVGAYALAFHGVPRYTGDIDIFVRPDHVNAKKIMRALRIFGFSSSQLTVHDFEIPDNVIQLGVPPVRVDLITSISGVTWCEAETGRVPGTYGDVPVFFIGKEEFIINKRATGRKKDSADLEALGVE